MDSLQRIAEAWARRTPRERTLGLMVAGLLAGFAVLLGVRGALGTIQRLDSDIARMQSDIVNYSYQIARRQAVEARYASVAAQHSSAWSESEIRDRLRQEIYRLSYRNPPRLDASGIPVTTDSEGEALVTIPELRGGQLVEGGEGYREYQIEFEVPPAPFPDMLAYLEYLLESPQSLRIDWIDLRRDPMRPEVAARIGLTRIVVDDPSGGAAAPVPDAPEAPALALRPEDWACEGCEVTLTETPDGAPVLQFAGEEGGRAYQTRSLPAGSLYDVELELAASAPVTVGAGVDGKPLAGGEEIVVPAEPSYYRCRFQFAVPASAGGRAEVDVPYFAWTGSPGTVKIRQLRIAPYGTKGMTASVIPAKAGIQERERTDLRISLDSRFRGNDAVGQRRNFEAISGVVYTKLTAPAGGVIDGA